MKNEILYMLGVIAVGFAVNYTLRALPFLLFAGRDRELPRWVEKLGNVISPVIIGCLIVYSYSGLEWKTAWPYLAGLLTVALQLWKRNPLVSIVTGTVLYMTVLNCCGCATKPLELDAKHPAVSVTTVGVKFGEELVKPEDVAGILEDYDVPKDRTIHILLAPEVKDLRQARYLMCCLARGGYESPVLVTKQHGESYATGKKPAKKSAPASVRATRPPKPAKIRFKSANE